MKQMEGKGFLGSLFPQDRQGKAKAATGLWR